MSKIAHLLATQDNQTTTQLNAIWHNVLGTAIDSASLTNAISQISIGHATLSTERWTLAHSSAVSDRLKAIITAVQNRPVNAGDESWVRWQQDRLGNGEQSIQQIRQSLARWSADNGQYDETFRQVHGRDPASWDRDYAANMIGNGWSVQDYRWNDAHAGWTAGQLRDLIPAVQGRPYQEGDEGWVRWHQDQLGNGQESMQQTRKDLATWSAQNGLYDRHFEQVHGFKARPEDRVYAGNMIGNGWSVNDYRWNEAHAGWTAGQLRDLIPAVQDRSYQDADAGWVQWKQDQLGNGQVSMQQTRKDLATWSAQNGLYDQHFEQVHGFKARPEDRVYAGNMIGNGWSVQDYRRNEALSEAAARDYRAMYKGLAGKDPTDDDVRWLQTTVANGSNFFDIRHNLAWSPHGRDAVAKAYAEVHGTAAQGADLDYGSGKLAQGQTLAEYRHAEVYNGQTAQQYRAMFVNLTGVEPGSGDVSWLLDATAKGSDFLTLRNNLAWSPHGRDAVQRVFARTAGIQNPTQGQFDWYQRALATGSSISDITNGIARAWEGESAVKRAYTEAGGITPSADQIRSWVNGLAQGTPYTDMRRTIAQNEGSVALKDSALKVLGRTLSSDELANEQAELTNGKTLADLRYTLVHSSEGVARLTQICVDCTAHQPSAQDLSDYQARQVAGASLTDLRYAIAHSAAETDSLRNAGTFLFGTGQTITTSAWLATQQDAIGSGQATYESTLISAQLAPAGRQTLQSVYQDWGQGLPTDVQLKTMATAMYHLNIAWNRVQYQSADQLAAEAATYHAIDGTASYGRMVENVSYSADQATALLASALTTPMMNEATSAAEFRRVISMGGTLLFETVINQMDVLNNIDTIQKQKEPDPCDPVSFKPVHVILGENGSLTVSNSEIGAANAVPGRQMAGVSTAQWSSGVQWTSQGNGIKAQGNPFEVWDAQRLKKEGYEWLADYQTPRSNWKAFDEWNEKTATAVSDKTMDLNGTTYQNMTRLQGRILANVQAMIRYDTDGGPYRYSGDPKSGTSLEFVKANIENYVLDLGVPVEPTDNQWRAICQALKIAKIRVAADSAGSKTIDFRIADIA